MHAVMQIGKILPQCLQELGELQAGQEDYVDTGIQEGFSESGLNSIDVAMDSAMRNIQGFKTATQNLTGKINVLLN